MGGYVVGNDSDFVIFNSEGYCGYIPLDEMVWQASPPEDAMTPNGDDDDFQTVKKPKAKRKVVRTSHSSYGLLPPENGNDLSLSFVSYSPQTLADHLSIPVSLLPLLGALVGNDFSKEMESNSRKIQGLFFERNLTLSQRIEKVASTIRTVISPGSQKRKAKHQVGSVMDLIDRTVNALLVRLTTAMGSGEVDAIVDKIVNATLQYAIPKYAGDAKGKEGLWPTSVCALHDPEQCSLLAMISHNVIRQAEETDQADPDLLEAREKYLDAYRGGLFSPKIMDILNTGSSWARIFLENPDLETVGRSIGKPIREWVNSIIQDSVGLEITEDTTAGTGADDSIAEDESTGDEDELVDVVESDDESSSDYLAPLKGELQRLHHSDDEASEPPPSILSSRRRLHNGLPSVTEYLRRGTRIASEKIVVKPISDLLTTISLSEFGEEDAPPIVLRSEDDRLSVLLRALKSDIPEIRALSPSTILPVLAMRWVVQSLHARWQDVVSKEREKERWTMKEARCFLSSFNCAPNHSKTNDEPQGDPPPIDDRNVQLMAQVLMALDSIEQLTQTLLLTGRIQCNFHQLSGKAFHAYRTGTIPITSELPEGVWDAVEAGLTASFQEERVKKAKKSKVLNAPAPMSKSKLGGGRNGLFAVLGDSDT